MNQPHPENVGSDATRGKTVCVSQTEITGEIYKIVGYGTRSEIGDATAAGLYARTWPIAQEVDHTVIEFVRREAR